MWWMVDAVPSCTHLRTRLGRFAKSCFALCLTWQIWARVDRLATNSLAYNGNDLRVQKVDSGGTHNYVTDGDAPAAPVLSGGSAVYTPGLSENRAGTSAFYHGDSIGSNRDMGQGKRQEGTGKSGTRSGLPARRNTRLTAIPASSCLATCIMIRPSGGLSAAIQRTLARTGTLIARMGRWERLIRVGWMLPRRGTAVLPLICRRRSSR